MPETLHHTHCITCNNENCAIIQANVKPQTTKSKGYTIESYETIGFGLADARIWTDWYMKGK